MGASASVIQEYYKAVDYWADIVGNRDWKLSVWIVGQNDVDLVDRFLEIERSPVGQFDDIFFRFDTPYRGDDEEYTEQLWQEYAGWFSEKVEEKYDILRALRHDGLLKEEYIPDVSVEHTAGNLWREMLRFKACISRLDDAFFCLYFPPEQERGYSRTGWFGNVLKEGVPQGIRMTTIDLKKNRSIRLGESREVVCIRPQFDMAAALHNRMARSDSGNDLIAPENRFKQQVTVVMDSTQKQDWKLLDREIRKLLDIAQEIKDTNIRISALLIASEACYAIREYKHSMNLRGQISKFLDSIQGPGRLIEKFKILRFERDPKQKDRIFLDIHLTPYFPAKSFVIKLEGTKGDDENDWNSDYAQDA